MAVSIKSEREINLMREAGDILALVHEELAKMIVPGLPTMDLDKKARELMRKHGCIPSFLNYNGYPHAICCSVNDEVVHGMPDKYKILDEGDIISLDIGVIKNGYQSDSARTYGVGEISPEAKRLIDVTKQSFFEGIKFATEGRHLHEISAAIEDYVLAHGYSCVRDLVGHGIGQKMHEDPSIPNFRQRSKGIMLRAGMTLAIEPMVNIGDWQVCILDDDWTVVTADGTLSAHYENTILVTTGEPELLSIRR